MNINMMNRNINSLIQITWNVKHLFKQPHYITVQRLIHTTQQKLQDDKRKRLRQFRPKNVLSVSSIDHKNDINWATLSNHYDIFSIINQKHENMTAKDAAFALHELFKLSKNGQIKEDIRKFNEFHTLCKILKNDMRLLSLENILHVIYHLNHFKVCSSTLVVQRLLQLIRYSVNQLSIKQGIFLIQLLRKLEKTPLVDALLIAVPVVLQTNGKIKLNGESMLTLISALQYFSEHEEMNNEIILHIMDCLNNYKNQPISALEAQRLLLVLLKMEKNWANTELVEKVYNTLTETINDFDNILISKFIGKIVYKQTWDIFYNANFIDACITRLISFKPEIEKTIYIMAQLNRLFHSNTEIIDYVVDRSIKTRYFSKSATGTKDKISLITAMAIANYKTNSWETLAESILNNNLFSSCFKVNLKLLIKLLALDCYCPELIETVFYSYDKQLLHNSHMKNMLLLSHNIIKKFYPQYHGPLLLEGDIDSFNSLREAHTLDLPLKTSLESIFGGPQYVLPYVQTQYGTIVDYVVILRKGGYPVALNIKKESKLLRFENIEVPKDSQIIFFILIRKYGYSRNTFSFAAHIKLFKKLVEINPNHAIISVIQDQWENLSELSRVKYLSDAIKLKTNPELMDVSY